MADYDAQPGRGSPAGPDLSAAQREADEVDLYAGLTGVAGLVAGARGVVDLLGDVAEFAARAIPGADGGGCGAGGGPAPGGGGGGAALGAAAGEPAVPAGGPGRGRDPGAGPGTASPACAACAAGAAAAGRWRL